MLQKMQQDVLNLAARTLDLFDVTQSTDVARFIKTVTIWMNLGLQSSKKNTSESSPLLKSVLFISSNAGLTGFVDMGGNA